MRSKPSIEVLFSDVAGIADPKERSAYLRRTCGDDPALCRQSEIRSRKLEERLQQKETEITELKQRLEKLEQLFEYKLNGGARCEPED